MNHNSKCFGRYNGHSPHCVQCNNYDCIVSTSIQNKLPLGERIKARIKKSEIKVSTERAPHTYMKAVGTKELYRIIEEEMKK